MNEYYLLVAVDTILASIWLTTDIDSRMYSVLDQDAVDRRRKASLVLEFIPFPFEGGVTT